MSAFVTPGNLRSALAVTRSLGRRGIPVTIADDGAKSIGGASRYCTNSIRVPSPAEEGEAFVEAIYRRIDRGEHQVLIPTDDVSVWLLAEARSRFEGLVSLPLPDREVIQLAHDKSVLMELAAEKGIPTPRTLLMRDMGDVAAACRYIGFPAVVKPRLSRFRRGGQWINGGGIHYVRNVGELESACRAVHQVVPLPLVQEYIPGDGRGISLLMNRGEVRAAFAHRRIREKPPSGGVSVFSESVALDPRMLEYSRDLLGGLKWHGVAMVEFKRDTRDGTAKLLEINGRFWGSLQLAVDCGVDFPYLLYRLATEGDIEPIFSYQEGVRLRWWLGDLDQLFLRLRNGREVAGRLGAVWDFVRPSGPRARAEVFRWDDPRPALKELSQYVGHILRGAIKRSRRAVRHE